MCTVWAALFLFLPLSVSVPLFHPPRLRRSLSSPNPPCPPTQLRFVCLSRSSSSLSVASRLPSLPRSTFHSSFPALSVSVFLPSPVPPFPPHSLPPSPPRSRGLLPPVLPFPLLSLRLLRALDFSPASFTVPRFFLSLVPASTVLLPRSPPALLPPPSSLLLLLLLQPGSSLPTLFPAPRALSFLPVPLSTCPP